MGNKMRNILIAGAAALTLVAGVSGGQAQNARVEVGVLTCEVSGGMGFIFGSSKSLDCIFDRADGPDERYRGSIDKFGIDIGATTRSVMVWGVLAPTDAIPNGAAGCGTTVTADQRSITRPQLDGCDIGAFEFVP